MAFFAEIILPLALPKKLTYSVPNEMETDLKVGMRVVVQLGKSKLYTGIISHLHQQTPEYEAKPILSKIDDYPIVTESHLKFWNWVAQYYMCTDGEVMTAALPSGLKLTGEDKVLPIDIENIDYSLLNEREHLIMEALEMQNVLELDEISKIIGIKTIQPYIKSLIEKNLIVVTQELRDTYKPKTETYIALSDFADKEENLKKIFNELSRAPKQLEALMVYITLSARYSTKKKAIRKKDFLQNDRVSEAAIRELVKKEILIAETVEIGRFDQDGNSIGNDLKRLSDAQQKALTEIQQSFEEKQVTLLHGVTSSGKTEIYLELIAKAIQEGKQVLYLVPEIALTTQLIQRITQYFPNEVGIYHSKFNENEKVEIWNHVLHFDAEKNNRFQIVVGARSALFLPFQNLGLVIVDEEHETSFKQQDPAPRYNARDAAIYLAMQQSAKVLLGSATPSVESYFNAHNGKYGYVNMPHRFGNVVLPEVKVVDLKEEQKFGRVEGIYSHYLLEQINKALEKREQVILFQNRRGYNLFIQCDTCGWTPQCKNCDISLTYHKNLNQLRCHYCGYHIPMVQHCGACHSVILNAKGSGTERIEDELQNLIPKARIARMDLDSTRKKNAYQQLIQDFSDGNIDILVGTQMITKGLDFEHVSLVGILNADNMLFFPDFRANERAFQLMEQVSGRAGRRNKTGSVVLQTYSPKHPVIHQVKNHDFSGMVHNELRERSQFKYPPYFRLIHLSLRNKDYAELKNIAYQFGHILRTQVQQANVYGPEMPSIGRIRNEFIFNFMIKIPLGTRVQTVKNSIIEAINSVKNSKEGRRTNFMIDVDPQ